MSVGLAEFGGWPMSRLAVRFFVALTACVSFSSILPRSACAQSKGQDTIEDLLKSIGLSKPAFTRAPDFSLTDAVGGIASISGNRGSLMLVNFWATWCGPCRDEMPSMEQLRPRLHCSRREPTGKRRSGVTVHEDARPQLSRATG
jgi:thiol-disulfide isomerase/thioredoxin